MLPIERPRRLRSTAAMRNLVAETHIAVSQLILPVFVKEGLEKPREIKGLPGVMQHNLESLKGLVEQALQAGVGGIMIFGIPAFKDALGSEALNPTGILSRAVQQVRQQAGDRLVITADLCLDEFTDHGHCGVLASDGTVDNDATLEVYARMAVLMAEAGAHLLGTSGMMDGQVAATRQALDQAGFKDVAILAYAAKYASAFYGPFRDAVESELKGDRKTYQQDPRNRLESMREIELDVAEGADIVMVKPATSYLDIVRDARERVNIPVAAYIVSGEMAMLESAATAGLIERDRAILEMLHSVKRAGADIICTYWALEVADILAAK